MYVCVCVYVCVQVHKYPQRLDYVFFTPGSLGELTAKVESTRIEKFQISELQQSLSKSEEPEGMFQKLFGVRCMRMQQLPYQSLSDHYGLGITLHCENTFAWRQKDRWERTEILRCWMLSICMLTRHANVLSMFGVIYVHVCMCTCMCMCMRMCTCICICMYINVCACHAQLGMKKVTSSQELLPASLQCITRV
jgi:hypothetical protein